MAISSNAGECQAYLQAALVVVRRFCLAHSCSCSGDGRDRLPHASPRSLTLPFNITHNLHGPSRRRTSPKVSLNTSVAPGFMMFSRCLLLSNSHEANTGISVSHLELRLHFGKRRLRPDVQALAAAIHGLRVETIVATWQEVHARSPTLYQRPGGEQAVALARS